MLSRLINGLCMENNIIKLINTIGEMYDEPIHQYHAGGNKTFHSSVAISFLSNVITLKKS